MDEFFKKMREIQKKERANSSLARVGEDFYQRIHNYIGELNDLVGNDPFANEHYLLKDTQRIATEICERREHKIADYAVMNIHRSYHLFKGKPTFDLQDTTPLNLTPEEEGLYFSLIDVLKNHKGNISLDRIKGDIIVDDNVDVANNKIANGANDTNGANGAKGIIDNTNNNANSPTPANTNNGLNNKSETIAASTKSSTNVNEIINDINRIEDSNNIASSKHPSTNNIKNGHNNSNSTNNIENPNIKNTNNNAINAANTTDTTNTANNINNNNNNNQIKPTIDNIDNVDEEFPDITNIEDDFEDINNIVFKENDSNKSKNPSNSNSSKSLFSRDELSTSTLLVFGEVPAIVGSNEKIYAPLNPQDIVTIPKINADIIVKSKKGRFVKS
ncbi:MAG: hypothetical protein ACRC1M_02235 [Methanobacteriaceae archaeon]